MLRPYLLCCKNLSGTLLTALKDKFTAVPMPESDSLPFPVSCHPDMLIFTAGDIIVTGKDYYTKNKALLDSFDMTVVTADETQGEKYPSDVLFNAFALGNTLFANQKYVSAKIKELFPEQINVRQGYAACSTCRVDEKHMITADTGIAAAAEKLGVSVLLISEGHVEIERYSHGFIGGASFSDGENVYFFGNIKSHPDHKKITDFIISAGKNCVSLSDEPLHDYGGAIIIKKYEK